MQPVRTDHYFLPKIPLHAFKPRIGRYAINSVLSCGEGVSNEYIDLDGR